MGLETSSQTSTEESPEIYREHSEFGKLFRTGPVFHRKGRIRLVASEPEP
jgi:hypothetical protein